MMTMIQSKRNKNKFQFIAEKPAERVVLFRLALPGDKPGVVEEDIKELELLTNTAGGEVVGAIVQKRNSPDPAHFIGRGKVLELKEILQQENAHTVICDDDLKPAQVRNIARILGDDVKILDRSGLILDIFATHARTPESKIQVELAQLEYHIPRLKGLWQHLERQYGAIGTRGPGEKQIETDRRIIQNQVSVLKKKLKKIERERKTQRRRRKDIFRVALVGYTNAGKSSLLNNLTGAGVHVEDKLFATLDATTRRLSDGASKILITDTVGFIKKLPHNLVESFKSTLAEAREADLLLIIADGTHAASIDDHIKIVHSELDEIEAPESRTLILNKIDLMTKAELAQLKRNFPKAHLVSALKGSGINPLKDFIFGEMKNQSSKGAYNENR